MKAAVHKASGPSQTLPLFLESPGGPNSSRQSQKRVGANQLSVEKGITPRLLTELQKEVTEAEVERGTESETIGQKGLLLAEEVFEVMKVLRVEAGIATSNRPAVALGDELADVLFVCAAIANRVPVDLGLRWGEMRSALGRPEGGRASSNTTATLARALGLARQVLEVVTAVPVDGDVSANSDLVDAITNNLFGVLVSIDAIAAGKKIDLTSALDGKMQKDQLRLWH